MTTEEFESLIEGGVETPTLDIKAACDWDAASMAKDILAMSNVQDGGVIIIGIEDGTFARQGITAAQKITYDIDIMRDQVAPFADPRAIFTLDFARDDAGLEYAVIRVAPFDDVPVICARNGRHLQEGIVYYRNTDGRVQSAAVSNAYDMRDIITNAAAKMMRRLGAQGFTLQNEPDAAERTRQALNDERENL